MFEKSLGGKPINLKDVEVVTYPKYIKIKGDGPPRKNFCFRFDYGLQKTPKFGHQRAQYTKCYGGWDIEIVFIKGQLIAHATYEQIKHMNKKVFEACTEEDLIFDAEFLHK